MKKLNYLFIATCLCAGMNSCGSSQSTTATNNGDIEIIVPCSGPDYQTNSEYIRASAMGLSTDMSMAKRKAMSDARAQIAQSIQAVVQSTIDDYYSSYQNGEADESKRRFEGMTRTVVNQQLNGLRTICEKTMKSPDGNYKVYIAMELEAATVTNAISNSVKADDQLRMDFGYEKFKQTFDNEMNKLKEQQPK